MCYLNSLFVLFIFCNSTDNFYVGADSRVVMLADVGRALCFLLLAILAMLSDNTIWWKEADLHHDGGNL
jgi:hypothetical protein